MTFQVVMERDRSGIRCGHVAVDFTTRSNAAEVPVVLINTLRGYLRVSTPEATAFDLVGYPRHAGGLSNVVTVLAELAERLDALKLLVEIPRSPLPWTQRLGRLLDVAGATPLAGALAEHVARNVRDYTPLDPGRTTDGAERDPRFKLFLNADLEADT